MHRLWQTDEVRPEPGRENHGPQLEERRGAVERCREKFWPLWGESRGRDTTEVAIAINCDRAADDDDIVRYAVGLSDEETKKWKESQPYSWITGSADYLHFTAYLGDPFVSDLKTGRREDKGPRQRGQKWVYALAAMLITGSDRVGANVVLHPRYPKADPPTALWATFAALELESFHDLCRRKYDEHCALKLSGEKKFGPGAACNWCPAQGCSERVSA